MLKIYLSIPLSWLLWPTFALLCSCPLCLLIINTNHIVPFSCLPLIFVYLQSPYNATPNFMAYSAKWLWILEKIFNHLFHHYYHPYNWESLWWRDSQMASNKSNSPPCNPLHQNLSLPSCMQPWVKKACQCEQFVMVSFNKSNPSNVG